MWPEALIWHKRGRASLDGKRYEMDVDLFGQRPWYGTNEAEPRSMENKFYTKLKQESISDKELQQLIKQVLSKN